MRCEWKFNIQLSPWLQYFYFLRFPILFWLVLPALCLLDAFTGFSSLTRGIMTLSWKWQAFHAAFFVTALMTAVLICTRNIVRNGRARFDAPRPPRLYRAIVSRKPKAVWTVLAISQLPTAFTLFYVARTTVHERETAFGSGYWGLWLSLALGLLAAAAFWYMVSIFYLWTYPADPTKIPSSLIYPGSSPGFKHAQDMPQPRIAVWIESAARIALRVTHEGYAESSAGPLWELHSLTTVSLGFILLLYLFLYPIVAPVSFSNVYVEAIVALITAATLITGFFSSEEKGISPVGRWFAATTLMGLTVFLWFLIRDSRTHVVALETSFPTLASVHVILIFFLWLLAGAGFLLDRYRIPVLTVAMLVIFLPKLLPFQQEHYFEALDTTRFDKIDTPSDVMRDRWLHSDEPYIIVTASGGGIQAAEWTAQVLAQLETRFRKELQDKRYTFHDHLLLASGVSGGSAGLLPYLAEYTADPGSAFPEDADTMTGEDLLSERLTRAPGCSSLEAVAWGMEYYDLQRLLLTVHLPWLQQTQKPGVMPDRTWALTEAFDRNRHDVACGTLAFLGKKGPLPELWSGERLTLVTTAQLLQRSRMPAFTFNTTVAETGGRFLLSNYKVDARQASPQTGPVQAGPAFLPAESFLQAYASESGCDQGNLNTKCYADITLATAARLSATFPAVSSGTRIPAKYAAFASHFLDGGYFDNDGTASVTEFLYDALHGPQPSAPLRKILLIEIRDGDDLNPAENADDWKHETGATFEIGSARPTPRTSITQLAAPLLGMWNANHVSVTRRNRRELCMLEDSLKGRLEIHHVVLGITADPVSGKPGKFQPAPLSWKLTEAQKDYIRRWAQQPQSPTQSAIEEAVGWVKNALSAPPAQPGSNPAAQSTSSCQVMDQTYMRR